MNPRPAPAPEKLPFPRGFRVYATFLGLTSVGAVGGPFLVTKLVSSDVASLGTDVKVLQTQQGITNQTLSEIRQALVPALDWQAERERTERVIRSMVKDEALKK